MVIERSLLIVVNPLLPRSQAKGVPNSEPIGITWIERFSPNWPTRQAAGNAFSLTSLMVQLWPIGEGRCRNLGWGPVSLVTALKGALLNDWPLAAWISALGGSADGPYVSGITRRRPESRRAGREGQQPYGRIPLGPPYLR